MSKKDIIGKTSAAIGAGATALRLYTDYKQKWDARRLHTLTITEESYVFYPMMSWLFKNTPDARHFRLVSERNKQYTVYNPSNELRFMVEGYHLKMEATDENPKGKSNEYGEFEIVKPAIVFSCQQIGGIQALQRLLDKLREHRMREGIQILGYNCSTWGWNSRPLPMRYIDKIFLKHGDKENLMSDIEFFMESEDAYASIGAPWHRGYLLYGPPGNGKTSLVQGLGHYYNKHIYNLPLSVVNSDSQLLERLSNVTDDSMLLVEDIDIFKSSVKRDQEKTTGPTLAGLLNAFDGINTPNGLITFFTTNNKGGLDPALIRPGRMDLHIEFGAPVDYQISEMFEGVYGEPLNVKPKKFESMAEYANVLKRNIADPETARLEIKRDS